MINLTAFCEDDKEKIPEVYYELKEELSQIAIIVCESDAELSEPEFALYMMKFSHNPLIKRHLEYIEKRISQLLEFNPLLRTMNEPVICPFAEQIACFDEPKKQLLSGQ